MSSVRRQGHFQTQAGHLFEPGVGVHEQVEDQPSAYSTNSSHRGHKISNPCLVMKYRRPSRLMTREPGWVASSAKMQAFKSASIGSAADVKTAQQAPFPLAAGRRDTARRRNDGRCNEHAVRQHLTER